MTLGVALAILIMSLELVFDKECSIKIWFKVWWKELILVFFILSFIILLFPLNRWEYESQGINKYLDKEIIIDKIEIMYNSQNQPIDTTYYYVKARK